MIPTEETVMVERKTVIRTKNVKGYTVVVREEVKVNPGKGFVFSSK